MEQVYGTGITGTGHMEITRFIDEHRSTMYCQRFAFPNSPESVSNSTYITETDEGNVVKK